MKNRTKTILALLAIGLVSSAVFSQRAQAVPITGSIAFLGTASASGDSSGGGPTTIFFNNPWNVVGGIGSYTGVPFGQPALFSDFTFTGDGLGATLTAPVVPLWNFTVGLTTYSFDLLSLTSGHTDSTGMAFTGTGIAHITGFDDTLATWALSGSAANGFTFVFATSTTTPAVPEGGATLALLGAGVGAIGLARKKLARV